LLCWFRTVDTTEVPASVLTIGDRVMAYVSADLGIDPSTVHVQWFIQEPVDGHRDAVEDSDALRDFPEVILRDGRARCHCRVAGCTPAMRTDLILLRADVFNSDDPNRDPFRRAVADELRHIWQHLHWSATEIADGNRCEEDAAAYALRILRAYFAEYAAPDPIPSSSNDDD
jgi:hypothetical protein